MIAEQLPRKCQHCGKTFPLHSSDTSCCGNRIGRNEEWAKLNASKYATAQPCATKPDTENYEAERKDVILQRLRELAISLNLPHAEKEEELGLISNLRDYITELQSPKPEGGDGRGKHPDCAKVCQYAKEAGVWPEHSCSPVCMWWQHYDGPPDEAQQPTDALRALPGKWREITRMFRSVNTEAANAVDRCAGELEAALAEMPRVSDSADKMRLDWLELKNVEVRDPMVYGSREIFRAVTQEGEEGESDTKSNLRAVIDAAMKEGK